ncbi:putative heme d1 biosynthesis radical SAM protein NirJ1 [Desulfotomaculum arcticum]|uniref:Mycofactocin maturase MftC n=1 Tax=Desulfotruncus arcticus DSM 17038 TaxID=1121424 RepID=A0A1I2NK74_9FIRM|nr:putative heme d1 biosynthesis radical SAM protein NirJ1 [Desulfotruncus arcticus]SFG01856.1 putative heme d1 biosynthesis radical SAM protein NirJ1 [Desulfotomaculum arcticum] [Desulfotruncus arcticus DSM 17038]
MISVSRLLCGSKNYGDSLRYKSNSGCQPNGTAPGAGPVIVWNMTRSCNLKCMHCYASSDEQAGKEELTTEEAKSFIDDLAYFNVPVILFSGGEPLLRKDFFELAGYAKEKGIRATISTNGTLITTDMAKLIKQTQISYVGISLDGIGANNDSFRGRQGAFDQALSGIRACRSAGVRVGLRFTINRHNFMQLPDIFKLIEEENIPRVCFYHLVYSGRGSQMVDSDISHSETRQVLDLIIKKTMDFERRGLPKEILTVDNHADGIYIYLYLKNTNPQRAERVRQLLLMNGGNRSGMAIGSVGWSGNVHPDQFTRNYILGNIRERKFADIWTDTNNSLMHGLKHRKPLLKGRCAVCRYLDMCNGNFRARAEAVHGDFWASDPACYLSNEEIQ